MAQYEWKQTIFTPDDFEGAGQYIVRETKNKLESPYFKDTGFLSTVMSKIGYIHSHRYRGEGVASNIYTLVDMSDGLIYTGYYTNTKDSEGNKLPIEKWVFNEFSGDSSFEAKQKICDYLNNNPHGETYRFATNEELIRVAAHQKWRTK